VSLHYLSQRWGGPLPVVILPSPFSRMPSGRRGKHKLTSYQCRLFLPEESLSMVEFSNARSFLDFLRSDTASPDA